MASRTYNLFMEARRAALAANGRLDNQEACAIVPEGVNPWTWAHSTAFAAAPGAGSNKDKYFKQANKIGARAS
jgi:hypothetical protein